MKMEKELLEQTCANISEYMQTKRTTSECEDGEEDEEEVERLV